MGGALARGAAGSPFADPDSRRGVAEVLERPGQQRGALAIELGGFRDRGAEPLDLGLQLPDLTPQLLHVRRLRRPRGARYCHQEAGESAIRAFVAVGVLTGFLRFFVVR